MQMRFDLLLITLLLTSSGTVAQAPVEDLSQKQEAILREQQKTSFAYKEMQRAQLEAQQAEQDYRWAEEASKAAQNQADELKRQADAAKKKLEAAKAREEGARKTYEKETDALDRLWQKKQGK